MRTATTKEFRNAVRLATASLGGEVTESWTDAPGNNTFSPKRYVGFMLWNVNSDTVAAKAEQLLNAVGVTAQTRAPQRASSGPMAVYRRSINYVRGTCNIG
jgi:hypothetical protein